MYTLKVICSYFDISSPANEKDIIISVVSVSKYCSKNVFLTVKNNCLVLFLFDFYSSDIRFIFDTILNYILFSMTYE